MSVYACSPPPTLLQYTSSVRALASLCPHDGIYMGVIAPELIVGFCTDPVVLGTLRLPPWHADHHSACSGNLYRQPMISSCSVAIPPHTTTLNWLNRCTNSGDISITRSAIYSRICTDPVFHGGVPLHIHSRQSPQCMFW